MPTLITSAPAEYYDPHELDWVASPGGVDAFALYYHGVDPARWPDAAASTQTVHRAWIDGVVVGRLVVHDQSGIVLWACVADTHQRQGIGRQLYVHAFEARGLLGLRNGCLLGAGAVAMWQWIQSSPGEYYTVREPDGGLLARVGWRMMEVA